MIWTKRAKKIRFLFLILLFLLVGRLYYVQILCAGELTQAAQGQQRIPVLWENNSGTIYDRNMEPLTRRTRAYYYLLHKDNLSAGSVRLLQRMDAQLVGKKGENYLVYQTTSYMPDASFALQKRWKAYGFCVNQGSGSEPAKTPLIADLETMYNELLTTEQPEFYFLGNGAGSVISGRGLWEDEQEEASLITTLDLTLQQTLEAIFVEGDLTGCAVITDTKNGQVLAMVSRSHEDSSTNLATGKAFPMDGLYDFVEAVAKRTKMTTKETEEMLGLGELAFDGYPGETTGSDLDSKKTFVTAVQMSQALSVVANRGAMVPLTLVMHAAQEEDCLEEMDREAARQLEGYHVELAEKPLTRDGWAVGYAGMDGRYGVVLYVEKQAAKKVYEEIVEVISS